MIAILTEFHIPVAQVYSTMFITLVLSIVAIIIGARVKKLNPEDKTPLWLVPVVMIVDMINNMSKTNLGKRWKGYAPYFLTLTIFLFFSNISGIFGIPNPTSYLINNAVLAVISFFIIQATAIKSNGIKNYIKGFFEPIFLLFPINLISEITLPVSLALRITGNVMSGGVISKLVTGLLGWAAIPVLPVINGIFDLFSGTIQCAVFLLLTVMFAGMKLSDEDALVEEKTIEDEEEFDLESLLEGE